MDPSTTYAGYTWDQSASYSYYPSAPAAKHAVAYASEAAAAYPCFDDATTDKAAQYIRVQMEAYQVNLMKRPARRQVDPSEKSTVGLDGEEVY